MAEWQQAQEYSKLLSQVIERASETKLKALADTAVDESPHYKHVHALLEKKFQSRSSDVKAVRNMLYIVSEIIQLSAKQLGSKDRYRERLQPFSLKMFQALMGSTFTDHAKRILALWQKKGLYPQSVLDSFANALGVSPLDTSSLPSGGAKRNSGASFTPSATAKHGHGINGSAAGTGMFPSANPYAHLEAPPPLPPTSPPPPISPVAPMPQATTSPLPAPPPVPPPGGPPPPAPLPAPFPVATPQAPTSQTPWGNSFGTSLWTPEQHALYASSAYPPPTSFYPQVQYPTCGVAAASSTPPWSQAYTGTMPYMGAALQAYPAFQQQQAQQHLTRPPPGPPPLPSVLPGSPALDIPTAGNSTLPGPPPGPPPANALAAHIIPSQPPQEENMDAEMQIASPAAANVEGAGWEQQQQWHHQQEQLRLQREEQEQQQLLWQQLEQEQDLQEQESKSRARRAKRKSRWEPEAEKQEDGAEKRQATGDEGEVLPPPPPPPPFPFPSTLEMQPIPAANNGATQAFAGAHQGTGNPEGAAAGGSEQAGGPGDVTEKEEGRAPQAADLVPLPPMGKAANEPAGDEPQGNAEQEDAAAMAKEGGGVGPGKVAPSEKGAGHGHEQVPPPPPMTVEDEEYDPFSS